MKKLLFPLFLLPAILGAQNTWKNLSVTPANPKPGDAIRIEFNWAESPLKDAEGLEFFVLEYVEKTPELIEPVFLNENGRIVGTYTAHPKAKAAAIVFKAGERFDNNNRQGYFIQMCDAAGKPLAEARAAQAALFSESGRIMDLDNQPEWVLGWLNKAFESQPDLKKKYIATLVNATLRAKRDEGKKEALAIMEELENDPAASETDLNWLINTYNRLKENNKVASAKEKLRTRFPNVANRQDQLRAAGSESDLAKKEALIDAIKKIFRPKTRRKKMPSTSCMPRCWTGTASKRTGNFSRR